MRRGRSGDDLYSVGELHTCDQLWQLVVAIEQGHSKNPSCDEGDRLGAILAEVFAGLAHGRAAGSDEVEDEIADRGERAGAGANATAILVHRHVTNVMQAVFDACACRKLDPYVLVMQSTQDRTGEYATNGLDGARNRRVGACASHCSNSRGPDEASRGGSASRPPSPPPIVWAGITGATPVEAYSVHDHREFARDRRDHAPVAPCERPPIRGQKALPRFEPSESQTRGFVRS